METKKTHILLMTYRDRVGDQSTAWVSGSLEAMEEELKRRQEERSSMRLIDHILVRVKEVVIPN